MGGVSDGMGDNVRGKKKRTSHGGGILPKSKYAICERVTRPKHDDSMVITRCDKI